MDRVRKLNDTPRTLTSTDLSEGTDHFSGLVSRLRCLWGAFCAPSPDGRRRAILLYYTTPIHHDSGKRRFTGAAGGRLRENYTTMTYTHALFMLSARTHNRAIRVMYTRVLYYVHGVQAIWQCSRRKHVKANGLGTTAAEKYASPYVIFGAAPLRTARTLVLRYRMIVLLET